MSTLRDEGFALLKRRSARLQDLIRQGVPDFLLVMEAKLIAKAAMIMNIEMWQQYEREDLLRDWKRGFGVCLEDDCDNPVKNPEVERLRARSWEDLYGEEFCAEHASQHLTEAMEALPDEYKD